MPKFEQFETIQASYDGIISHFEEKAKEKSLIPKDREPG
jgi:hypothetical protein